MGGWAVDQGMLKRADIREYLRGITPDADGDIAGLGEAEHTEESEERQQEGETRTALSSESMELLEALEAQYGLGHLSTVYKVANGGSSPSPDDKRIDFIGTSFDLVHMSPGELESLFDALGAFLKDRAA